MYLFILLQIMTIEGWHLILTSIGVVTPLAALIIMIDRSRKKDWNHKLEKKADKSKVIDLEKKVDRINEDFNEKTREIKQDFFNSVSELNDKFDMLLIEVIKVIKEKKK